MSGSIRTLLVSAALVVGTTLSPAALAKCPKSVVGVWSGLLKNLSFSDSDQLTDSSVAVVRIALTGNGAASISFEGKNSSEPLGETGAMTGTFVFDPAVCRVRITAAQLEDGELRMQVTDNGRVMLGIGFGTANSEERKAEVFMLYRE